MVVIPFAAFPWMEDMVAAYVVGFTALHMQPREHRWQTPRQRVTPSWYGMLQCLARRVAATDDHGLFRAIIGLANALPLYARGRAAA